MHNQALIFQDKEIGFSILWFETFFLIYSLSKGGLSVSIVELITFLKLKMENKQQWHVMSL